MKNNKKVLLSVGMVGAVAIPVAAVVSCGIEASTPKDYTVGFAIDPISSLNYIKYKSSLPFAHSLVEGITKTDATSQSALKNYMSDRPTVWWNPGGGIAPQNLGSYSISTGTLRVQSDEVDTYGQNGFENIQTPDADGKTLLSSFNYNVVDTYNMNLNGKSKWANGDALKSSDFIDFFGYVLDLNTGSQLIDDTLSLGLEGADAFVNAQTEYAKKFKVLYKNPFGYITNPAYASASDEDKKYLPKQIQRDDKFPLQINNSSTNSEERRIVDKIEEAAKNIGIYGDDSSSHPYKLTDNDKSYLANYPTQAEYEDKKTAADAPFWQDPSLNDIDDFKVGTDENNKFSPFKLRLKTKMASDSFTFIINVLSRSKVLPVNRSFIENQGGVEKFGLSADSFMTEGPFKMKNLILGNAGSVRLEKDDDYYESSYIIPDSVKIFFQSDPVIKSSLFEDGYISQTKLTGITSKRFYSDPMYRTMLSKGAGFGTTGLTFNLDPNSEGYNKYLSDVNLRKAIFYSVDRGELIKLSGFDATTPSYALSDWVTGVDASWIAPQRGVTIGLQAASEVYTSSHGDVAKLYPYAGPEYGSTGMLLGNLDKTDKTKNYETAKYYFNLFKKDHPEAGKVKIEFTNDSTKAQINIGTTLQTQINEALGSDAIDIELKSYPKSIYDSFYASGKFQLAYVNMDHLEHGGDQYAGAFMTQDAISKEDQKATGFSSNPSGAWTFEKVFALPQAEQDEMRKRLEITQVIWDKIKELSTPSQYGSTPEEKLTNQKDMITAFFARVGWKDSEGGVHLVDDNFKVAQQVSQLTVEVNKIIMDQCPVIPLFVVDVTLQISRMAGFSITSGGGLYSFDYGYDLLRKPRPDLPGLEALEG